MAYDVARVRGLHPSLGDGWVHFDAPNGMLLPDSVATTVSTAFRGAMTTGRGPHPAALHFRRRGSFSLALRTCAFRSSLTGLRSLPLLLCVLLPLCQVLSACSLAD